MVSRTLTHGVSTADRPTVDGMTTTTTPPAGTGIAGLDRIAQVKLPVTDLARSVDWYRRFLGLRLWVEIVEDGVVRGSDCSIPKSASTSHCATVRSARTNRI
jgi:hypothetical protein